MIFPFPGNERTGTNTSLIQYDVMPIKPAPGAACRNGQHPKPYSVSEVIMVMDWFFISQNLKLDSTWLWGNQLY